MQYYNDSRAAGDCYTQLRPFLLEGEQVLWSGRPYATVKYLPSPLGVLFSLFFFGFSIFWTASAFTASVFFALFGLPFMVIGAVLVYTTFFGTKKRLRRTVYAVTDRRAMILQQTRKGTVCNEYLLATLMQISLGEERGTSGNIFFNTAPMHSKHISVAHVSGVPFQPNLDMGFLMIDNVRSVYLLIQEQMGRM